MDLFLRTVSQIMNDPHGMQVAKIRYALTPKVFYRFIPISLVYF